MNARLAELLGALSLATDSANGVAPETAIRVAMVSAAVARHVGLRGSELQNAYYAGLLRFLGCTSFAHETAARYAAGDDRALLSAMMPGDATKSGDVLRRVAKAMPADAPIRTRAAAMVRLATEPSAGAQLTSAHCALAAALATQLGLDAGVVTALEQTYERHDGRGAPAGVKGESIVPAARAAMVGLRVVAAMPFDGPAGAVRVVRERRGEELHPAFADAFLKHAEDITAPLAGDSVWQAFLDAEPLPRREARSVAEVASAFADYTDLKSPWTIGHSRGVAALCERVAVALDVSVADRASLQVAALLHDLGRVAVPNGVWDKRGPLGAVERERAESHAWHTGRILARTPLFADVVVIAAQAHERSDASGYPGRVGQTNLTLLARILAACDVLHALTEARPHRHALDRDGAAKVLLDEARAGRLDARVVDTLLALEGRSERTSVAPDGLSEREVEVLLWLARGLSNKEIADQLGLSPKTVQHHVAHVYEKTKVKTRAAAAIYAVQRGLLAGA